MALAIALTGPAFAGAADLANAKTAADCAKAGGIWDASSGICSEKKM